MMRSGYSVQFSLTMQVRRPQGDSIQNVLLTVALQAGNILSFRSLIQSASYPPQHLDLCIEEFLSGPKDTPVEAAEAPTVAEGVEGAEGA
jgi:hypothetical protein